jgi:hypothetical protein
MHRVLLWIDTQVEIISQKLSADRRVLTTAIDAVGPFTFTVSTSFVKEQNRRILFIITKKITYRVSCVARIYSGIRPMNSEAHCVPGKAKTGLSKYVFYIYRGFKDSCGVRNKIKE